MLFMNDYDVAMARQMHADKPVIGKAVELLSRFVDLINENSDGWAYWVKGPRAAKKLMELIQSQDMRGRSTPCPAVTEADYKVAIRPMKSFCTRQGFTFPE